MTSGGVTDTAIEVAGRRLNPQALPEWQLLLTHLEISEGFSFVVLLVPDVDWANACRIALSHSLDAEGKSLQTIDFSGAKDFKTQLPARLLDLHVNKRTGAVWLEQTVSEASPQFAEWEDAWRGFVARLNQLRNPLRRHFDVPLVFVGANWLQPLIRENAPDLWSVRTLVTRVQPFEGRDATQTEGITEQQLDGLAIDSDLALRAASRLRGQTGKELVLAELLDRAGRGLLARSQWTEAEKALREATDLQHRFHANDKNVAITLLLLGESLRRQYKFDEANASVQKAQQLFLAAGDVSRAANCIQSLGDIALGRSEVAIAQARYEEALPLYRGDADTIGEAHCIERIGDIAFKRGDYKTAQTRYEEALPLYRTVGAVLGEANCIKCLGDVALEGSDYATAQARYEEALPLYRHVGDLIGEANCIRCVGNIALARSDLATAQARFEEALPLYRRIGSILGEANCMVNLGDIARIEGSRLEARAKYLDALRLSEQTTEPYSIGRAHLRLAEVEQDSAARKLHLDAARKAWTRIDRPDLIKGLEEASNPTENQ